MDSSVFLAVIGAALLHATWNALVKGGKDKFLGMTAVVLGHSPIALTVMPFVPLPAAESWPYLAAGVLLHVGYQLFLLYSYRIGDLTQVYPIARGSAPIIVAMISIGCLEVDLSRIELIAVATIAAGIISLSLVRQHDGLRNGTAALLALTTGCFIAGYSLVDGTGARLAGTSLGFYCWLAVCNAVVFALFIVLTKPGLLSQVPKQAKGIFIFGGASSFLAYASVTWAFTQAPIALVTALREISIVFALLIGVTFLKERLDLARVVSTLVALFGVALLRFAKH